MCLALDSPRLVHGLWDSSGTTWGRGRVLGQPSPHPAYLCTGLDGIAAVEALAEDGGQPPI